jgi:hypothetical protein
MPKAEEKSYYCSKCNRTKNGIEFYASNNLEKYPNEGKLNMCKECLTMHVDNWDPNTFLWILQEVDVPYIPEEWQKLMASWAKDRSKVTGMTILGRYLSKMKLKQFKDYRWEHTEFLQELAEAKKKETMERQGYDAAEIATAIARDRFEVPEGELPKPEINPYAASGSEDYFGQLSGADEDDAAIELSPEEQTYLRLKWGKTYKPMEWVQLEQLYEEMMESYDIQSAGHVDTLKLVCKTSLKANQLLDIGDVDGAQKMVKMYDGLMKSGKFTAAQNKAENGEGIDSISAIVAICERDGFIPRYYTDGPQDKVDWVIRDLKDYTRQLVTEEMNLGSLIERAVKQIEDDRVKDAELDDSDNAEDNDEAFERSLFEDKTSILTDQDFMDFSEFEDEEQGALEDYFDSLGEEE